MPSIFTKIINNEIPCYKIAENDKFLAFLDVNPIVAGHTLVIPKLEVSYIFDMQDDLLAELVVYAKKIALAIDKTMDCKRVGLSVVGLEVPHTHIHLVPINQVSDISFNNPRINFTKEEYQEIANKIISAL